MVVGKVPMPCYVLICDNKQVGAMEGPVGLIAALIIFPEYRGVEHSEIFLELIEQVARTKGVRRIETTSVSSPEMISALKKCGFALSEDDRYYEDSRVCRARLCTRVFNLSNCACHPSFSLFFFLIVTRTHPFQQKKRQKAEISIVSWPNFTLIIINPAETFQDVLG